MVAVIILEVVKNWRCVLQINILKKKLGQIYGLLATLRALQHFDFFWTPAAKGWLGWLGAWGSDCYLTPKMGHLEEKKEVALDSWVRSLLYIIVLSEK